VSKDNSKLKTYDLTIGEDIKGLGLGLSKMQALVEVENKRIIELHFYNGKVEAIKVTYGKDLEQTTNSVKQAFIDSHQFDNSLKLLDAFSGLLTECIIQLKRKLLSSSRKSKRGGSHQQSGEDQTKKTAYETAREIEISKIKADIDRVMKLNPGISVELWRDGLEERYKELKRIVDTNIPEIWPGLEFALSSLRILNIYGCTLPFIGIILARPSSYKTVVLNLLKPWYCTFYTDSFSPKAWITHTTAVDSEEKLSKIDMLPKVKDRHFLTPELAPIFTVDEKDLGLILGTITRIADGHGFGSDSGVHGHREYGDTMFVWTGAAVDIPHNVYKMLSGLGFKIYFFRLPYKEKTEDELLEWSINGGEFNKKKADIGSALYDYLGWFEIGPTLIHDQQSDLYKMEWDNQKDDRDARRWIVRLAMVLTHLRCIAQTWRDKSDSTGSTWGFHVTQPEAPERAMEVLRNLARGHALLTGRNFVTLEDIPIVVKTVLSTAHLDKVGLLFFLISNKGRATTEEIRKFLNVTRPTALRNMTELEVTRLVDVEEVNVTGSSINPPHSNKSIKLKEKFNWMLGEEFQGLCEGFTPVDNREFLDDDKGKNKDGVKEKEKEPCKANPTPYTPLQISVFWRIFGELEDAERRSNPGTEIDKTTISEEKLHDGLVSTGKFIQSDAAMIIQYMKREEFGIEQVDGWGTIRRKAKP
jgi:hypothetical protein